MMRKTIPAWLLLCMLLLGCSAAPPETEVPTPSTGTSATQSAPTEGFYEAGSALEVKTQGAVRVYPLTIENCGDIAVLGQDILLFSAADSGTVLTKLTGDNLVPAASTQVDAVLHAQDASVLVNEDGISFYDEGSRKIVILDENLREVTTISAPENMMGAPLLSFDRSILYYCTGNSICAMDLETRIPRVLRQFAAAQITLDSVIQEDSLLQCRLYGENGSFRTQFLSTQTGQLIREVESAVQIADLDTRYIAILRQEEMPTLVFGTADGTPQTLYSGIRPEYQLLSQSFAVLDISADSDITLDFYDLSTGLLRSTLTLEENSSPYAADGGNGIVWLLAYDQARSCQTLYRWDTTALPSGDNAVYAGTYYTRSNPDLAGIAQCQALAEEIGQRHGVEILVWEDAIAMRPWDYCLTEEYLVPVLVEQLNQLDQHLGNFPEGFLSQLSESCSGLTICLVRQLTGSTGTSSLESAAGIQFWVEDHAYIALSTLSATEGSLYHELCHVIDTRVFSESNAYDQWEALNPNGFEYDYDYTANASRNAGEYLRDAERYFIDTYSMSFPKEDRARILEYAMTAGHESYFQSKTMQNKLRQICIGFREAFGLKKSEETFLWEQYLKESLAYSK